MMARLDAMVLGPGGCSHHETGGHRTGGHSVDAILDHGGPIVTQSLDSVLKFRSLADEHHKCRYGSLE